jgi:hypothetical protein
MHDGPTLDVRQQSDHYANSTIMKFNFTS